YARCEARLAALGRRAAAYPIDASGWLLLELIAALAGRAGGGGARIAHWPHGHRAAAVLTHDLEPRRYAYGAGLDRLLARPAAGLPRGALGLVARPARRHLRADRRAVLAGRDVYCHGLDHRGEPVRGARRVARQLTRARALLERHLGRTVDGYRSPRLDRSPDLDRALDRAGFRFDSSHPDVDRENPSHYGRGVRLCLPYRAPLDDGAGGWRPSRCLEVPLTAPDCIQPLFAGADAAALADTVRQKAAWVRASGGCYVALVHAGVFGPADAARREAHLQVVGDALAQADTWCTTLPALVEWWTAREQLHLAGDAASGWRVANAGPRPVAGATLLIEAADGARRVALPALAPHATYDLPADGALHACSRPSQ
ncbi:MAG: polysaccharide deacetylase family protein, partial [Deltaproteobacteria bacterium]|nr:polysaccharide deacetylase family protein [Deltaproteobacteria bacterium]